MKHLVDSFSPVSNINLHQPLGRQHSSSQWLSKTQADKRIIGSNPMKTVPQTIKSSSSSSRSLAAQLSQSQNSQKLSSVNSIPYAKAIRPHLAPPALLLKSANAKPLDEETSKLRPYQQVSSQKNTAKRRKISSGIFKGLQVPLLIVGAVIAGLLMQSLVLGEAAICLYAIIAVVLRINSRVTFQLALITLIAITVLSSTKRESTLISNFTVYTFLLLIAGTISLFRETRRTLSV